MKALFALLCLLLPHETHAAPPRLNGLFGLDFAKLTDMGNDAYSATHFAIGASADFAISERFFLEPGLRYIEKGAGARGTSTFGAIDIDFKIQYLEVPLFAKYRFGGGHKVRPFVYGGPNVGIKLGERIGYTITTSGTTLTGSVSGLGDSIHTFNLSADAGAGADFLVSDVTTLFVTGGYSLGLVNVANGTSSVKTRDIQVLVGAGFQL